MNTRFIDTAIQDLHIGRMEGPVYRFPIGILDLFPTDQSCDDQLEDYREIVVVPTFPSFKAKGFEIVVDDATTHVDSATMCLTIAREFGWAKGWSVDNIRAITVGVFFGLEFRGGGQVFVRDKSIEDAMRVAQKNVRGDGEDPSQFSRENLRHVYEHRWLKIEGKGTQHSQPTEADEEYYFWCKQLGKSTARRYLANSVADAVHKTADLALLLELAQRTKPKLDRFYEK